MVLVVVIVLVVVVVICLMMMLVVGLVVMRVMRLVIMAVTVMVFMVLFMLVMMFLFVVVLMQMFMLVVMDLGMLLFCLMVSLEVADIVRFRLLVVTVGGDGFQLLGAFQVETSGSLVVLISSGVQNVFFVEVTYVGSFDRSELAMTIRNRGLTIVIRSSIICRLVIVDGQLHWVVVRSRCFVSGYSAV